MWMSSGVAAETRVGSARVPPGPAEDVTRYGTRPQPEKRAVLESVSFSDKRSGTYLHVWRVVIRFIFICFLEALRGLRGQALRKLRERRTELVERS